MAQQLVEARFGSMESAATVGDWRSNHDAILARRDWLLDALQQSTPQQAALLRTPPAMPSDAGLAALHGAGWARFWSTNTGSYAARARAIDVWIALERWRNRHGEYPERLDELVPEFLPVRPIDPMDGAPFGYRRRAVDAEPGAPPFLLWTTGPDGIDDGGTHAPRRGSAEWFPLPGSVPPGADCIMNLAAPVPRAASVAPKSTAP